MLGGSAATRAPAHSTIDEAAPLGDWLLLSLQLLKYIPCGAKLAAKSLTCATLPLHEESA